MVDKSNDQFGYSINIKNFEIYGYLGLNKEEKSLGQKFIIDVKLNLEEQSKNIKDEFEVLDIKKTLKILIL